MHPVNRKRSGRSCGSIPSEFATAPHPLKKAYNRAYTARAKARCKWRFTRKKGERGGK